MSNVDTVDNLPAKALKKQVDQFVSFLEKYNSLRQFPRSRKEYDFLRDFYPRYITDQNNRTSEVDSPAYKDALATAKKQFPHKPYWVLCVDGRVLVVLAYGGTADIDDSVRVPGGMLREFVRGTDGKMFLREESNFAWLLNKSLEHSSTDAVIQVFDSHLGCAARNAEEQSKGKYPKDAGLLADVRHKRQMVAATTKYVKEKFADKKRVITIQTSFDPHTGFIYMGLETANAFEYAMDHGGEFSDEMLEALAKKNMILSGEELAQDDRIRDVFKQYDFPLAWKTNYVQSATSFWQSIDKVKDQLFPIIKAKLLRVYPHLAEKKKNAQDELAARATLLLANAFSGFLENEHPQDSGHTHSDGKPHHMYSYGVHEEEGVRVSEGGYPPYEISMFVVFSLDEVNLATNIDLAVSLVRANRKEKRVEDRSGIFKNPLDFAQAPVAIALHELIRDKQLSDEDWEALSIIDWSDLPNAPWDTMTDEAFDNYLESKGKIPLSVANGIRRLRHRMRILFDPDQAISHHLVNQDEVVLPLLADRNRRIRCLIPFVKLGFV